MQSFLAVVQLPERSVHPFAPNTSETRRADVTEGAREVADQVQCVQRKPWGGDHILRAITGSRHVNDCEATSQFGQDQWIYTNIFMP